MFTKLNKKITIPSVNINESVFSSKLNKIEEIKNINNLKSLLITKLLVNSSFTTPKRKRITPKIPNLFKICKRIECGPDAIFCSVNLIIFR